MIIINPFSGSMINFDTSTVNQRQLDAYSKLMDANLRKRLHNEHAPCTPGEFLEAWGAIVGPEEAGRVIFGS
jgi:hypothetical protein